MVVDRLLMRGQADLGHERCRGRESAPVSTMFLSTWRSQQSSSSVEPRLLTAFRHRRQRGLDGLRRRHDAVAFERRSDWSPCSQFGGFLLGFQRSLNCTCTASERSYHLDLSVRRSPIASPSFCPARLDTRHDHRTFCADGPRPNQNTMLLQESFRC